MSELNLKHSAADKESAHGDISEEESAGEMTWSKPVFDSENLTSIPNNQRLLKKKRMHYNSFSHAGISGLTLASSDPAATQSSLQRLQGINRLPYGKNSRKSRNGYRDMQKKVGSNKDVWIRVSDELDELELDHDDPDYDSEENESVVIDTVAAVLDDEEFEKYFSSLVHEYYDHCKVNEVIDGLKEINLSPRQRRRLPFLAINLALQHKMSHCELTSELLSEMCGKVISMSGMQHGFKLVLEDLPDIVLDVPKAPEYVGRFIARAVADDILPPKFVQYYKEVNSISLPPLSSSYGSKGLASGSPPSSLRNVPRHESGESVAMSANTQSSSGVSSSGNSLTMTAPSGDNSLNYAMQAINQAENLLMLSHAYSRLDIVWGIPPAERVTTLLMKQISAILDEYLRTDNLDGATASLQELDSPHYHHELVYQAILLVLDRDGEHVVNRMLKFLDHLCRSVVMTLDQLATGVKRIYVELPEIQRELPVSHVLLERFLQRAVEIGFLPKKLANEMPAKARKRFVSEGDSHRKIPTIGRLF